MGAISLLPLLILFAIIGAFAWFGYQIYLYSNDLATHGKKHLEKKNISFSSDGGMKVGVQDVRKEDYEDSTQSVLVKTWNLANESKASSRNSSSQAPKPVSRTSSGTK